MIIEPATEELSTDDLANLRRLLEPLRQGLRHAHGRHGLRSRLPPIGGALLAFSGLMAMFLLPLMQAASSLFEYWDGFGLAALLSLTRFNCGGQGAIPKEPRAMRPGIGTGPPSRLRSAT